MAGESIWDLSELGKWPRLVGCIVQCKVNPVAAEESGHQRKRDQSNHWPGWQAAKQNQLTGAEEAEKQ